MSILKRGSRTLPTITTSNPVQDQSLDIASNMEKALQEQFNKMSVQPQEQETLFDQITSIISGTKPRYPSVEVAVSDMQDRSGFTRYQREKNDWQALKQSHPTDTDLGKAAQSVEQPAQDKHEGPELFKENPEIRDTFDNYITDTRGNISIPAILERVHNIHKRDADDALWNHPELLEYISKKCDEVKEDNPDEINQQGLGKLTQFNNEGDVDPSNLNAFHALETNKAEQSQLMKALAAFDAPKNVKAKDITWISEEDRKQLKNWGTQKEVVGNPPSWVENKAIWTRAKKEVKKHWKKYEEPYGVIAHVYRSMGGKTKKPSK
jgi:hypothetical protein